MPAHAHRPSRISAWLVSSCVAVLCGCDAAADIVASPIVHDSGANDASQATDGGGLDPNDPCNPAKRFQRAHLPDFAFDLLVDCKVRSEAFSGHGDAGSQNVTPEEFSQLISVPMLESDAGLVGEALCNSADSIGWYAWPLKNPDRAVLCPKTCELYHKQIAYVLAQDGCDGPFDAGARPPFGGFPGGPGFPGSAGGGGTPDDDAGRM